MRKTKHTPGGTATQLAEIKALQNEIQHLIIQLNRPYAMLASLLIIPPLVHVVFLNKYSPLADRLFTDYSEQFYNSPQRIEIRQIFETEFLPIIKDQLLWIASVRKQISPSYQFTINIFKKLFPGKRYNFALIDKLIIATGDADWFENLKKYCINYYNELTYGISHINNLLKADASLSNKILSSELLTTPTIVTHPGQPALINDIDKYSFSSILDMIEKRLQEHRALSSSQTVETADRISSKIEAMLWMQWHVKFFKIIATMIFQYIAIDPLLNRFFPHGILQRAAPEVKKLLTVKEVTTLITQLKGHKIVLANKAKRNVAVARFTSLIFSPLMLCFALNIVDTSPEMMIVALTFIATALINIRKDFQDFYQSKNFNYNMAQQEKLIIHTLAGAGYSIERVTKNSIDSSYFTIQFHEKKIDNALFFSSKRVAKFFQGCCLHLGVAIHIRQGHVLIIPANIKLDINKAKSINELFHATLRREASVYRLINQLEPIEMLFPERRQDFDITPQYDDTHLTVVTVRFFLPKIVNNILNDLSTLFKDHQCQILETAEAFQITLTGYEPLTNILLLNKIITDINNALTPVIPPLPTSPAASSAGNAVAEIKETQIIKQKKSKKNKHLNIEQKLVVASTENSFLPPRLIHWESHIFDSSQQHNNVYPIPVPGEVHSKSAYVKARFFVTSQLNWDKISQQGRPGLSSKVENLIQYPRIIRRKKGEQGFNICYHGMEVDTNGKSFEAVAKGKMLGKYGNVRLYAAAEKASNDPEATLFIVKGIKLKAH